ncbi:metallophosphoesterase [Orbaceae bacterium ac157xtp]
MIDLIKFIGYIFFRNKNLNTLFMQVSFLVITAVIFVIGLYSATNARIINYQVNINKHAKVDSLRIVQLSDIHVNETTSPQFIKNIVEQTNSLNPDYIFITGDTLDLRLQPYLDKNVPELFSHLTPKYSTFIIFGNHEHYGIYYEKNNEEEQVIKAFEDSKMQVLKDSVYYDNRTGVYIVGRDDRVIETFGLTRESLDSLLLFSDKNKSLILMDHQPKDLREPQELDIDLMFSGHTHAGQIFPVTLIVQWLYQNAWGEYKNNTESEFTSIVTSGYGLWGPPIRLMSVAEIVVVDVTFKSSN